MVQCPNSDSEMGSLRWFSVLILIRNDSPMVQCPNIDSRIGSPDALVS